MTDIWSFLSQTLTASAVAALLLVVKRLFLDKLSPRWQYGVWGILALRLLLPAGLWGRYILFDGRAWLEAAKTAAERSLSSVLASPFALTAVTAPVPLFPLGLPAPGSVTDLLFYLYAAGALACALWFLLSYLRLRHAAALGTPADGAVPERLEALCRRYGLKRPARVAVLEVETAFVCGPLRPVLILPAGGPPEDKVLLHELLHLTYGDVWAGVLLCALRCLHWCNPLIWYCCDRAQNDCEALCDQRVLERLEEERRDYGRILLSMADGKYARAPGTSSMANGGRNIRRRIQAIARFKRYPAGMALASLCVAAVLALTCLVGTVPARSAALSREHPALAMAQARLNRPSTPAGALDTYVKALLSDSGAYLAMVTPPDGQEALWTALEGTEDYHLGLSAPLEAADFSWVRSQRLTTYQASWSVLNLLPDGADGCRGLLVLRPVSGGAPPLGQTVHVRPDGPAWTVEAESALAPLADEFQHGTGSPGQPVVTYAAEAAGLRIEIDLRYFLGVNNTQAQSGGLFSGSAALDPFPGRTPFTKYYYSKGGRAWDRSTGEPVRLGVHLVPLASDGSGGGNGTSLTLPDEVDGSGGGFSSSRGVGLDWAAALSLTFTHEGRQYTCTALPEGDPMNRDKLCYGLTKVAWAYVLLLVDLRLGALNLFPNWGGYLLIGQAIPLLAGERRDLTLLRPFCLALGLWSGADWLLALFGLPLSGLFQPLDVVVKVVSLYFNFQLLTDLAALAGTYQGEGWTLDKNLRACRSVTAVLGVALFLPVWDSRASALPLVLLSLFGLVLAILIVYYLFTLRKVFEAPSAQ